MLVEERESGSVGNLKRGPGCEALNTFLIRFIVALIVSVVMMASGRAAPARKTESSSERMKLRVPHEAREAKRHVKCHPHSAKGD